MIARFSIPFLLILFVVAGCKKDPYIPVSTHAPVNLTPRGFPEMKIPDDNPSTEKGIALGRKLFFDEILSADSTQSCGSCHDPKDYFVDNENRFSIGIDKIAGTRNSMPLFNIGFSKLLFWDGSSKSLEEQALAPVENPIEMHNTWQKAVADLNKHPIYPSLFKAAFPGLDTIDKYYVAKAIAQFERTLISANSKFDQYRAGLVTLSAQELRGQELFVSEKADCFHCHSFGGTFTDFEMRNNGLDLLYADAGYALVTGSNSDIGKFKTPSLRNIMHTAPYMHDGRFKTVRECIDHYNDGVQNHPNASPLLTTQPKGRLSEQDIDDLIAFLETLTDVEFINNPNFQRP